MPLQLFRARKARVCNEHVEQNLWHLLPVEDNSSEEFTAAQIMTIVSMLQRHITEEILDFEQYENIAPAEFHTWTGLTQDQFTELLDSLPSLRTKKNKRTVLAAVLVKLRTGDSNARLANIFKCSETAFHTRTWLKIGPNAPLEDFVPLNVGFDHISREDVAHRNLFLPNNLFGNPSSPEDERKVITICDGTYIYPYQKSGNYFFQRKSYSHHKYRNLLKPFLLVSCDGHIIEVNGPYAATTSDADIMNDMLNNADSAFHWFYRSGDVFILDRGFRDSARNLESCGYVQHMPQTKCAQFTLMTVDMPEFVDFPRIDENELLLFALGVYQLKQAKSYYGEYVLDNGAFTIELSNELSNEDLAELQGNDLWMIRGRLQSRHVRARQYYVYIIIGRIGSGRQAIAHYYCSCII
ncbi:unnamed protein product [Parnassius apollo]|uniref:(apollo) hypothetical protein n=1 Tax=Parnassius apollo TaxID=110799 RepID=A0A8S3WSN5_PARAO|nr:unnamed protein product [Parnassius apollo]